MLYIFYTIIELIYYSFIAVFIVNHINFSMSISAWILFIFSLLISLIPILLMHLFKDRKKYFIISSIYIIFLTSIFHLFGKNILNFFNIGSGLVNFTMYLYKILFMFSPLLILYFLGLHKLFYNHKKKQLYFLIALRRIFILLILLILANFLEFSTILYIITVIELFLNILPLYNKFYQK